MPDRTADTNRVKREETNGAPESAAAGEAAKSAKAAGGLKAWLPLIITLVTMPALAFATTRLILLPKIEHAMGQPSAAATSTATATKEGDKNGVPGKTKIPVPLTKMLVNVAGTMGTRYLMTSITLVGNSPDFKSKIEDNKDQLLDLATGTLSSKTISDIEKPGARNVIRAELTTVFNNALGGPVVQEIYITEFAIQ